MQTIVTKTGLILLSVTMMALISGCASQPKTLYYWGTYQEQVYNHLKGKTAPEEQIIALEETRHKASADGAALPPGYHAHLGMLYGEVGKIDQMQQQLVAEKTLFPEATGFMDFLMRKFHK